MNSNRIFSEKEKYATSHFLIIMSNSNQGSLPDPRLWWRHASQSLLLSYAIYCLSVSFLWLDSNPTTPGPASTSPLFLLSSPPGSYSKHPLPSLLAPGKVLSELFNLIIFLCQPWDHRLLGPRVVSDNFLTPPHNTE